nr:HupE/UreJ family protein [uncultured Roseovarius sp.]
MKTKLYWQAALSSLIVIWSLCAASAHEVSPSIADLTIEAGTAVLELQMNAEAFIAGINLDDVTDTNETDLSDRYDTLRALPPEVLTERFRAVWPDLAIGIALRAGAGAGAVAIPLNLERIEVDQIGNTDLPRRTTLTLQGAAPVGASTLVLAWGAGFGELVLRQQGVAEPYTGYIRGGAQSDEIAIQGGGAQSGWQAFAGYVPVGFDHILPKGLDHILFVLGLFFLSARLRPLLWQVTAFTAAHTVTLALGALGWVNVPGSIVEPLIAASITYVAVENILARGLTPWRPVVVFCFGLLHGLGFASVLGEFGLPADQFIPALIGFNVGVELGQLTVIALAFLAVGVWFRNKDWYRARIAVPASCVIATVGAYWFVERVFL